MGRKAGPSAHLVVLKDNIHAPVEAVFHRPVHADRLAEPSRARPQAADIKAALDGVLVAYEPFTLDDRKRSQARPLLGVGKALQMAERIAAARLQSPVPLFHALGKTMWCMHPRMSNEAAPEVLNRFCQPGLIVLDRQHIVGAAINDSAGDGRLCAHGVDGHHAASQRKKRKSSQRKSSLDLVGLFFCGPLPQHHPGTGRKSRHQMQFRSIHSARTPAGLAVDSHHLGVQGWQNPLHPAPESGLELAWLDQPEHPPKGVVRSNAVDQGEITSEPIQLLLGPYLGVHKSVGSCKHSRHRYNQQFNQVVLHLGCLPGILNRYKYIRKPQTAARIRNLHPYTESDMNIQKEYLRSYLRSSLGTSRSCDCTAETSGRSHQHRSRMVQFA